MSGERKGVRPMPFDAPSDSAEWYCKRCDFYTDHVSTQHDGLAVRGLLKVNPRQHQAATQADGLSAEAREDLVEDVCARIINDGVDLYDGADTTVGRAAVAACEAWLADRLAADRAARDRAHEAEVASLNAPERLSLDEQDIWWDGVRAVLDGCARADRSEP